MELISGDVSSSLGASFANALFLDLQAMDLLKSGLDVKKIMINRNCTEKNTMKVKSNEKHKMKLAKLVWIGADGKFDKETLVYQEVTDENGEMKPKKGREHEHHLTFTKKLGTECETYLNLTHRVILFKGAIGVLLGEEFVSVLEEFNSTHTLIAVLFNNTNTNTGWEGGLVTC
ncbi:Hypothetical predicted protein [Octopus vulgaris]|uniref:Uncharacterized protein n=1 Tax=Octopus vulgaris TaxID=6645 RepID=A0AA36AT28_OCTVU|nr:Hypothetical predicted protein [Octopus vulgaris]